MLISKKEISNSTHCIIYSSLLDIDKDEWHFKKDIPFYQSYDFLLVIEQIHPDLSFRYVCLQEYNQTIGFIYFQLLNFSFKNLVNYQTDESSSNYFIHRFKKYIAQKSTKLLHLGNVFFTGDNGVVLQKDISISTLLPKLFDIVRTSFNKQKPTASLLANIYVDDTVISEKFCEHAFRPFSTEPDLFMNINQEWNTMNDYLQHIISKYRVRANKIYTLTNEISIQSLTYDEIIEYKDNLHQLYDNVINNVAFNMAILNIDFFERMKQLYAERCVVSGYFFDGKLVGFTCLFHIEAESLHIHYIGLNYAINKELKLYNRMLLDFVAFAIQNKIKKLHFGRTATEIKTTIGAQPMPLNAYLKMHQRFYNLLLPSFLKRIKAPEYTVRNPFKH